MRNKRKRHGLVGISEGNDAKLVSVRKLSAKKTLQSTDDVCCTIINPIIQPGMCKMTRILCFQANVTPTETDKSMIHLLRTFAQSPVFGKSKKADV